MSKIEENVCNKILRRAAMGLEKYKTDLTRLDLDVADWLVHAQEEALDLANYLEVLIDKFRLVTTIDKLQRDLGHWSDSVFGKRSDPSGPLKHLKEEVDEVLERPDDVEEWADCLLLLLDAARIKGIDACSLLLACQSKLEKNKQRKWGKPDSDGIFRHKS